MALAPLAPITFAVMVGVVADRFWEPATTRAWAASGVCLAILHFLLRRHKRARYGVLLGAFAALGAGYHHHHWSDLASDDLAIRLEDSSYLSWLKGVLIEVPDFHPPEQSGESGYTHSILAVTGISDGKTWHRASGRVRLTMSGRRDDLQAGMPVKAAGVLSRIPGPTNPGEVDYRDFLRAEGVRLRLSVNEPGNAELDPDARIWWRTWCLGWFRSWSHARLTARLDPRTAPLAAALLLGRREAVSPEVNDAFARTGTTHLLAISGLHLQVLAVAIGWTCFVLGAEYKRSLRTVLLVSAGYAVLVGFMPSVVRSVVMIGLVCLAGLCDRPHNRANQLSAAALATMAWNPSYLFDVGCQLSFLAVAVLYWGDPTVTAWLRHHHDPLDILEETLRPRWQSVPYACARALAQGVIASAVVWLITLPLVMLRFHLISPIAIILNLPLVPLTSAALLFAGITLGLCALWTPLGSPAAWICSQLLSGTEWLVRWGTALPWGHRFTSGPSASWVLLFYLGLGLAALATVRRWSGRAGIWTMLGMWILIPLIGSLLPWKQSPVEAEILDVGHGLAVMIRTQSGRAVLYDCGKLREPHVGRRVIAPALWAFGESRIETVILSHADTDHVNGLSDLMDRFPIGSVVIPIHFEGLHNPAVGELLEQVRSRGIPIRSVRAGDRLEFGPGFTATALLPGEDSIPDAPDNDHSLVLDLSYRAHHLLLTGDLEGSGLADLVAQPRRPIDVMIAPHHGGRSANPFWLYDWARPGTLLVSQKLPQPGASNSLESCVARGIPLYRTADQGAIQVRWTGSGLSIRGYHDSETPTRQHPGQKSKMTEALLVWVVLLSGLAFGLVGWLIMTVIEVGAWTLVRPGGTWSGEAESSSWKSISSHALDGVRLSGAWCEAPHSTGKTVILLHGYGEDRTALLGRGEFISGLGWNVALLDARGRGHSGGCWTTFGTLESRDLIAWLDVLEELAGPDFFPVAWGRSLGAITALRAAVEGECLKGLVLESPYADLQVSLENWFRSRSLPSFLAGWILWRASRIVKVPVNRPRPMETARLAHLPVLILCGAEDRLVAVSDVRDFADAFAIQPILIIVPGARHQDVFEVGGQALSDRIIGFLETVTNWEM